MTKRMQMTGFQIVGLENQLTPSEAVCEVVDNAGDHGAKTIDITITPRAMTIWDDGDGCDDPNLIATPGYSRSRFDPLKIGKAGMGAKQGLATFGRHWDIMTVPRDKNGNVLTYHRYIVHWDENDPLAPEIYSGKGHSVAQAPKEIRNGGTKLVVLARQEGLRINLDGICRSLERAYRPALTNEALSITVRDPTKGYVRRLKNAALDPNLFVEPVQELVGAAAGHSFKVRFGVLKEADDVLSGCHVIFGWRVIGNIKSIGKHAPPAACYIDVILERNFAWKRALGTNKNRVRFESELNAAIEALLNDWLTKQRAAGMTLKMRVIAGIASANINTALIFLDKKIEGEFGPKKRTKVEPKVEEEEEEEEDKKKRRYYPKTRKPRRTRAEYGTGTFGIEEDDAPPTCLKINIVGDETLAHKLFHVIHKKSEGELHIALNVGPEQPAIRAMMLNDPVGIQRLGMMAYAAAAGADPVEHSALFEALRRIGYDIDEEMEGLAIQQKVAHFLMHALATNVISMTGTG